MISEKPRILVAMSGGVDSSVAALLLKEQGYDIAGAYMKNWVNEDNPIGECPWQQDIDDARATCERIGIPFQVVNLMKDYRHRVVDYLLKGYQEGFTPNPDIMCNREIKFGVFRQWAFEHGFNAVATGHYAQNHKLPDGSTGLYEGVDNNKDQSYFLALLNQEQIRDAYFPIGHLKKPQLREIAEKAKLPNAGKKDSQGICFIGQIKMKDFLKQYVPDNPGPILRAEDNKYLGLHKGLHYFTLGQRKGIGIPSNTDNQNYVVVGKRSADNALLVSFASSQDPTLHVSEVRVHSLQWNCPPLGKPCTLDGRVRYRDPRVKLDFIPDPPAEGESAPSSALIRFHTPQRSLASGQILALYEENRLLGGGIYI